MTGSSIYGLAESKIWSKYKNSWFKNDLESNLGHGHNIVSFQTFDGKADHGDLQH